MSRERTDFIVVHCSATPASRDIGADEIDAMHRARGWRGIGYHAVIRLDGTVEHGRALNAVGAHTRGHNRTSIGVCLIGGVNKDMEPACTVTPAQLQALQGLITAWHQLWPDAEVVGHRDLSPDVDNDGVVEQHEWLKACPSFEVGHWLKTGEAVFRKEVVA